MRHQKLPEIPHSEHLNSVARGSKDGREPETPLGLDPHDGAWVNGKANGGKGPALRQAGGKPRRRGAEANDMPASMRFEVAEGAADA